MIADFLAELVMSTEELMKKQETSSEWELFVDDFSNAKGNGAGILLKSPHGELVKHSLCFGFQ